MITHRARLRFGRALLCYDMHRFKYKDIESPKCPHCGMNENETVNHTIARCTAYTHIRNKYVRVLNLVMPACSLWMTRQFDEGAGPAICPEMSVGGPYIKYLKPMMYVTGKLIDDIQQTRKY